MFVFHQNLPKCISVPVNEIISLNRHLKKKKFFSLKKLKRKLRLIQASLLCSTCCACCNAKYFVISSIYGLFCLVFTKFVETNPLQTSLVFYSSTAGPVMLIIRNVRDSWNVIQPLTNIQILFATITAFSSETRPVVMSIICSHYSTIYMTDLAAAK